MNTITITIESNGKAAAVEIPTGVQLSLMEVLKAAEYPVMATCGGMAICATCHVEVLEGSAPLMAATDAELDMLDTLPEARPASRLACQMPVTEEMNGMVVRILADMDVLA